MYLWTCTSYEFLAKFDTLNGSIVLLKYESGRFTYTSHRYYMYMCTYVHTCTCTCTCMWIPTNISYLRRNDGQIAAGLCVEGKDFWVLRSWGICHSWISFQLMDTDATLTPLWRYSITRTINLNRKNFPATRNYKTAMSRLMYIRSNVLVWM